MSKSILLFVFVTVASALAMGCMPNADRSAIAFSPRSYPYMPELGPVNGK